MGNNVNKFYKIKKNSYIKNLYFYKLNEYKRFVWNIGLYNL